MAMGPPFDLPYELWDDDDRHVEELIALTGDYRVARAAYEEAIKRRPGRIITLRQKTRRLADNRREGTCTGSTSAPLDDRNDGLTRQTAIYSWQRAVKLCDGSADNHLRQDDANLKRLAEEIAKRRGRA